MQSNFTEGNYKSPTSQKQFLGSGYLYEKLFPSLKKSSDKSDLKPSDWGIKQKKNKQSPRAIQQETNNKNAFWDQSDADKFKFQDACDFYDSVNHKNHKKCKQGVVNVSNCETDIPIVTETWDINSGKNEPQVSNVTLNGLANVNVPYTYGSDVECNEKEFVAIDEKLPSESSYLERAGDGVVGAVGLFHDEQSEKINKQLEIEKSVEGNYSSVVRHNQSYNDEQNTLADDFQAEDENSKSLKDEEFQKTDCIDNQLLCGEYANSKVESSNYAENIDACSKIFPESRNSNCDELSSSSTKETGIAEIMEAVGMLDVNKPDHSKLVEDSSASVLMSANNIECEKPECVLQDENFEESLDTSTSDAVSGYLRDTFMYT